MDSMVSVLATDAILVACGKPSCAMDRARIANIAAQILDLERSICELRMEKDLAQQRLDSYIYPVLTLPNEIVSEIFVHFLPEYPLMPPSVGILSPTLLTHICRKWRNIAHATPALWRATSLEMTNNFHDEHDNERLLPWMARSRSYPLSIRIVAALNNDVPSQSMETVTSYRARWEYLQFTSMTGRSLPLLCGPMPSLRHLNVLAMADFPSVTLGDAPLLRYVRIVGHPAVFILPWRQLTFLVLEFVFRDECATVLQQTAVLVHCELSFSYSNFDEDQLPKIELPLLQSLILLKEDPEPTPYLHNLVLPALRTLQIVEVDLGYDPIFELSSFLSKSRCALRELHMHITGDQAVKAAAYRTAFPTIPELLFTHGGAEQSDSDSEE